MAAQFPLETTTDTHLQELGRVLWSWPICNECYSGNPCEDNSHPSKRSKRLLRFFEYYRNVTAAYNPDIRFGERPALQTHNDLFRIIQELKREPELTRNKLMDKIFPGQASARPSSHVDHEVALNITVRVMFMIICSAQHHSPYLLEHGISQVPWQSEATFTEFITKIFPRTDHPSLNDEDLLRNVNMKTALMARKLKKRAGLKFRATDDLGSHLRLDRKMGVVEIFHHTAFLKEHLKLTIDESRHLSVSDSLKL